MPAGKQLRPAQDGNPALQKYMELLWFFLKNFGLLMHVDALSYRIVDFSLVFIVFAARRKTIMEEFSPVQKCLLFLVFLNNSGRDSAWSNAKLLYFHRFYNDSASDTITSYDIPANNAKYSVSKKLITPYVFKQIRCVQPKPKSQIDKNHVVAIALLKFVRIYNIGNDTSVDPKYVLR